MSQPNVLAFVTNAAKTNTRGERARSAGNGIASAYSDATQNLGPPMIIRETFVGFQKYLYQAEQESG